MRFDAAYDIPHWLVREPYSPAYAEFLRNWFVDSWVLTRGELDLAFLKDLSSDEVESARLLLRCNLPLKYTHIIEGIAALHDVEAAPILKSMLRGEMNLSRQLTIAGTLWKLNRDPVFVHFLEHLKRSWSASTRQAHFGQILWLNDERAIGMLIDLLDDRDDFVQFLALEMLNRLEFEGRFFGSKKSLPHDPAYYRDRRRDSALLSSMVAQLRKQNEGTTPGVLGPAG